MNEPLPPANTPKKRHMPWAILIVVVIALALGLVFWLTRKPARTHADTGPQLVAATTVQRENLYNEVIIPAEFRPYVQAELDAKVTGYLSKINVDFGDTVKAGQVLAVLEVPELHDQLTAAIAAKERARADFTNADLVYTRLVNVDRQHPNLVAEQDIDTARAKSSEAAAAVASADAEASRYKTLVAYTQIIAPFDGVITGRYADPGALIQAGTMSTSSKAFLRVSDNYLLRLDFPVSVEYVKDVHLGAPVEVRVTSLNEKIFTGNITRATDQVNDETRTMITEIEVPNPKLEIIPGMYAEVLWRVRERHQVLSLPNEAVESQRHSTVYVIDSNNKIVERPVTLGLETPTRYEILSGLQEGERVMVGSRSLVHVGEIVECKPWVEKTIP